MRTKFERHEAAQIHAAINGRFFDSTKSVYDKGSQNAYAFALLMAVPAALDRPRVLENLKAWIACDNYHVKSGFVGIIVLL